MSEEARAGCCPRCGGVSPAYRPLISTPEGECPCPNDWHSGEKGRVCGFDFGPFAARCELPYGHDGDHQGQIGSHPLPPHPEDDLAARLEAFAVAIERRVGNGEWPNTKRRADDLRKAASRLRAHPESLGSTGTGDLDSSVDSSGEGRVG